MNGYQLKYENGYEIRVFRNYARVDDKDQRTRFSGTLEECERWLSDRGLRPIY